MSIIIDDSITDHSDHDNELLYVVFPQAEHTRRENWLCWDCRVRWSKVYHD